MKRKELIKIKYDFDKSIDFTVNIEKFNKKSITYRGMDILVDKVSLKKDKYTDDINVSFQYRNNIIVGDKLHNINENIRIVLDEEEDLLFLAE